MISLAIFAVYLVGWVTSSVVAMRAMADRVPACRNHYACIHFGPHWRGDGEIGGQEVQMGSLVAIAWPILWLPALAFLIANRRPTPRAMQNRIAELEREAGIR